MHFSDMPHAQFFPFMPHGADGAGTLTNDSHVGVFVDCQALETDKDAVDGRVRGLQAEITEAGESGVGANGSGGSETLQKELMTILTELTKASTEVPLGLIRDVD